MNTEIRKARLWRWLSCLSLLLIVATFLAWAGRAVWPFALIEHFRLQLALGCVAALAGATVSRRWATTSALLACLAINAGVMLSASPALFGVKEAKSADTRQVRLMTFNIYRFNERFAEFESFVRDERPDVIFLQELTPAWARNIGGLSDLYPHRLVAAMENYSGAAILSRFPLRRERDVWDERINLRLLMAQVKINQGWLNLATTHLRAPWTPAHLTQQEQQVEKVASVLAGESCPMVLAGDFNATPWSRIMEMIQAATKLQKTAAWPAATFPHWGGGLGIPIDSFLFSNSLVIDRLGAGPSFGSDHRSLLAALYLNGICSDSGLAG